MMMMMYSAAGRGVAAVSSAIEESDLYPFSFLTQLTMAKNKT